MQSTCARQQHEDTESRSDNRQVYMESCSWRTSLFLFHGGHAALHLFRRHVFKMYSNGPFVSPGIFNGASTVAIKLVGHGLLDDCALATALSTVLSTSST